MEGPERQGSDHGPGLQGPELPPQRPEVPDVRGCGVTLIEAAAMLQVTPDTLRQQIRAGRLRAQKLGRDWHVTPKEIARYDAARKR